MLSNPRTTASRRAGMAAKITKSDAEWRAQLTPEQYQVTRQKGTEDAFSGEYAESKAAGAYVCVCCGQPLFSAETKFDSGTGWPSFWQPGAPGARATKIDHSRFMRPPQAPCTRCRAHLGRAF